MAALTILACSALEQFYNISVALVRCGFNISKTLRYLRAKNRLILFNKYCREVWLQNEDEYLKNLCLEKSREIDFNVVEVVRIIPDFWPRLKSEKHSKSDPIKKKMQRNLIDFTAMEATALAAEATDGRFDAPDGPRNSAAGDSLSFIMNEIDDIEVLGELEIDTTFYDYVDTLPVYHNDCIPTLSDGVSYIFTGNILMNCERFSINFKLDNNDGDVALHINPRLPQNYIVRNTKVKDTWGREEVSSALPFSLNRGAPFSIQVLVTKGCYMISVNGQHFAEYNHRLPYTAVTAIEVKGDVEIINVSRLDVNEYPSRLPESEPKDIQLAFEPSLLGNDDSGLEDIDETDGLNIPKEWRIIPKQASPAASPSHSINSGLTLPYYGKLPGKSLIEGRCLKIEGRVKILPHSFYINLQKGRNIWPHPIVALHFNPRFSKQSGAIGKAIVCRNAWYNGNWAQEERSELVTDFRPGKTFSLAIVCGSDSFEVYVNRKFIIDFRYHVKPEIIDTVYIQGDIKLWNVVLESNLKGGTRIYQNPAYTDDF